MGQRKATVRWGYRSVVATVLFAGTSLCCDGVVTENTNAVPGTVASLSPAATDLLVAMGLTDRVVAVSTYETQPRLKADRPIAGDYLRIDWETLSRVRPEFLIVQGREDRLPPGIKEHAKELHIKVISIQIDRLEDIYKVTLALGQKLSVEPAARDLVDELKRRITKVENSSKGDGDAVSTGSVLKESANSKPSTASTTAATTTTTTTATTAATTPLTATTTRPSNDDGSSPSGSPSVLITIGDGGRSVVGRGNYLDDILTAAGGRNAVPGEGYIKIDNERLDTLGPDIVIALLPGASDERVREQLSSLLTSDNLSAVRNREIYAVTSDDVLLPATPAIELAEEFAKIIRKDRSRPLPLDAKTQKVLP